MKLDTLSFDSRLRKAATLLMALPSTVAAACFAHGHGALGSGALLAVLVVCIAAGAVGSYLLLSLIRKPTSDRSLPLTAVSSLKR